MTVQCIIYDLDGTLVDSGPNIAAAVNRARRHYDLPLMTVAEVIPSIGYGARRLVERTLFGRIDAGGVRPAVVLGDEHDIDDVFTVFMAGYAEDPVSGATLLDGVEDALRYWHERGVAQAVLTNKPHPFAVQLLDALGLSRLFQFVFGRGAQIDGRELRAKPDPDAIEHILSVTASPRAATWMVGDGVPDVQVARAAGIGCVALTGGFTDPARLLDASPTAAVPSFRDAFEWIKRRA